MSEKANAWLMNTSPAEKGKIGGDEYWIVPSRPMQQEIDESHSPKIKDILTRMRNDSGYNGYIRFKKRPVRELGYSGIMKYVPVWGGITYAREDEDGIIYGFDTCHINQEKLPIRDLKWIKGQIKEMRAGILRAAKVEDKYLSCKTKKGKIKHAQYVYGKNRPASELGYSALIDVMFGEV